MNSEKAVASYSIILGIAVISMWISILLTQTISEGKTELAFHLVSEFLMAASCILTGILIFRRKRIAPYLNLLALGMVFYSLINAAGYYAEKGVTSFLLMFVVLLILTIISAIIQLRLIAKSHP